MDKNKNRTDLLAAGRKKLQQYRQKKDGKGSSSHGKSSKKSSKSEELESDVDAASAAAAKPTVPSLPEVENASPVDSTPGVVNSNSKENSSAPTIDVSSSEPSSVVVKPETGAVETVLSHDAKLPPQNVDCKKARALPSATSGIPVLEGQTKHADVPVIADVSGRSASVDTNERVTAAVEADSVNRRERQESMPSQEVIPDTSLVQARGDQVTDVGAMQGADCSGLKQLNRSGESKLKGDEKLVLSESVGSATILEESASGTTGVHETTHEAKPSSKAGDVSASVGAANVADGLSVGDGCSISLSQLKEVVRGLGEDEFRSLLNSRGSVSNAELGTVSLILSDNILPESFEKLKEELYLTNFRKDIFHLQLTEMSDLQMEFDHQNHQLVDELSLLRSSLDEVQKRRECLAEDLAHCNSELHAVTGRREELENQVHSVKAEAQEFSARAHELQISLERSQGDLSSLSMELVDCKALVASLQVENETLNGTLAIVTEDRKKLREENANLNGSLVLITEERKKLEEEKESLACENERLSNELLVFKEHFPAKNGEHVLDGGISTVLEKPSSDSPAGGQPLQLLEREVFDGSFMSVVLKRRLEEAEKILQNLEKGIEEMHSESMSFNRSSDKVDVPAPPVSKLIQAFESNSKGHPDEHEAEQKPATEEKSPADPFMLTKVQTGKLRSVLQQLHLDVDNAKTQLDGGRSSIVKFRELKVEYEALMEHSDNIEASNIELGILYEVVKQYACGVETRNNELEVLYEALKQQDLSLKAEYGELGEKLSEYQSRVGELLNQLHDLQHSSDEKTSATEYQLESLKKEATERALILEQKWNSTVAQIVKTLGRLDESIGRVSTSAILTSTGDDLDVNSRTTASVNATIKVIEELQEKLEAAHADHETVCSSYKEVNEKFNDLIRNNDLASGLLHQIYGDLRKLYTDSCGSVDDEPEMNIQAATLPESIIKFKTTVEKLENFLHERLDLKSLNNELNSELVRRTNEIEELNRRCLNSNAIQRLMEDVEGVMKLENTEISLYKTPASHLEFLVSSLVQKYKEAGEQVSTSREELRSKAMESTELQEEIHQLNASNLKHEIEFLALKDTLSQAEEALTVSRTKLQEKTNELEQLDQRAGELVSSSKEELGSKVMELTELQEMIHQLNASNLKHEREILVLKDTLSRAEEALTVSRTKLQEKTSELEQLDQRAGELVSSSKKELESKVMELTELQEKMHQLNVLNLKHENEILALRDTSSQAEEALVVARTQLHEKVIELEQADQRAVEQVSSSREEFGPKLMESSEMQEKIHQLNASNLKHEIEILALKDTLSQAEEALAVARAQLHEKVIELEQSDQRAVVEHVRSSREESGSKVMELTEMQEKIHELNALNLKHEIEILALKDTLSQAEEALTVARTELQEKVSELEQSDQRVASIREKLGIAVSKGKGLVVQRDSLKQSLSETSKELERYSQESQLKDARLHELEAKLKTYMEAGERVEALESELSYIRNSATALRESFLLKDSVLQRIEEILEDLDLPEYFHSRDITEKVDWLARSATGNSLPVTDWDQKSSVGGSYPDAGFVVMDAWKEDAQLNSSSGDDLRRKYEELQSKFYGLAEQNEMLEQSLMERNHLVQRWEELLDRINMPTHLRSVEPEDRIEWLGTALLEANQDRNSLQQRIDKLENYCGLLTADLDESQKRVSDLEADLQGVINERERLSERLEILICEQEKIIAKTVQVETENVTLQSEVTVLQEELAEQVKHEERIHSIEDEISRLEDLVSEALQDPVAKECASGECSTEFLEQSLRKLIQHYSTLSTVKPVLEGTVNQSHTEESGADLDESRSRDVLITEEPDVACLKKDLDEALHNLMQVKEERDTYMDKQQSLVSEVEALDKKREELQELFHVEEQKSASLREKLNVAVRKGKSLVQQRDGLKQTLEQMNNELEHLKSEISHRENALAEYENKIRDLSTYPEMVQALESERVFLRNRLAETEHLFQEREHTLSMIINALGDIDVGSDVTINNPVEKLERIGKLFNDLHAALASSEQETRKSRRAAELLLAELNEVQERNDSFQEELAKADSELTEISKERDVAEAAKFEALSRLERLSTSWSDRKQKQYSELMVLKSNVNELRKGFSEINNLLADVFSKDFEYLHNLEANMESCLKQGCATDLVGMSTLSAFGGITSFTSGIKENLLFLDSWSDTNAPDHLDDSVIVDIYNFVGSSLQELKTDIGALRDKLHKHPVLLHDKASSLFNVVQMLRTEMTSREKSFEALKRDITRMESIEKEKDTELVVLRRNIALLYEACANSVMEIGNRKAELVGNNLADRDLGMNLNSAAFVDGGLPFGGQTHFSSEESVKAAADRLLSTLKDFASMKTKIVEGSIQEMKITIASLQREIQEKDIQKDRICAELVGQIKEAEAAAQTYLLDLQSSKSRVHNVEQHMKGVEEERSLLEQRLKELLDEQAALPELQDRMRSLSDMLAAKDQEIEALMQALDEEEIQMEEFKNKVEELEKVVQQKNRDLESLEASRGKISKRLSVTVSKFDELHHLSENLLAEVEKLQSQLQDRDAEISFLRQEVTRCTNDVLVASQMSNKRDLGEIQEFLSWFDTMISQVGVHDVHLDDNEISEVHDYKEILQKKISAVISEFEDLQVVAQNRDALLQVERSKVQELKRREEILQKSLCEKESQINMLEGVGDSGRATSSTSEILEVEPMINNWGVPGPSTTSQVRSLRKVNNDQVAIAVDLESGSGSGRLEDEEEEKVHGFKSLTTSRIIPRFTRPATDMIDGLWVSCDRALMRQPALRLCIITYWAILHALIASFVF